MRQILPLLVLAWTFAATAQTSVPTEFPADAAAVSADALTAQLSGKVYASKLADGASWRMEYKGNGYFFINTSTGFNGSGRWRTEGSRLCTEIRNVSAPSCNEVRQIGERLYLKRNSGEVIALVPR